MVLVGNIGHKYQAYAYGAAVKHMDISGLSGQHWT